MKISQLKIGTTEDKTPYPIATTNSISSRHSTPTPIYRRARQLGTETSDSLRLIVRLNVTGLQSYERCRRILRTRPRRPGWPAPVGVQYVAVLARCSLTDPDWTQLAGCGIRRHCARWPERCRRTRVRDGSLRSPLTVACKLCANCRREPRTWESVDTSTRTVGANEGEVFALGAQARRNTAKHHPGVRRLTPIERKRARHDRDRAHTLRTLDRSGRLADDYVNPLRRHERHRPQVAASKPVPTCPVHEQNLKFRSQADPDEISAG